MAQSEQLTNEPFTGGNAASEPISEIPNSNGILSFISPENLACDVAVHIFDLFKQKFVDYNVTLFENDTFVFKTKKQMLCKIKVHVNEKYAITVKFNSVSYTITHLNDLSELANYFEKYISNLRQLYTYIEDNYSMVLENDFSDICIYDHAEFRECGYFRKIKYRFECDDATFSIIEKEVRKTFKSIEELDKYTDLTEYKSCCKMCCMC